VPRKPRPVEERFRAKYVEKTSGCWVWTASCFRNGYGQFRDSSLPTALAHRVAWIIFVGPIPDGMQIDHLCRNTLCVNPAHMELVTNQTNSERGRGSITECKHGHPYNEENTYWKFDQTRGWRRSCRICAREAHRRASRKRAALLI